MTKPLVKSMKPLRLSKPKTTAIRDARYIWLVDNFDKPSDGVWFRWYMRPSVGYYAKKHKWTFAKYGFKIVVRQFLIKHFAPPKMWYYFAMEKDRIAFQEYLKT